MTKGRDYFYIAIEEYAKAYNYDLTELGNAFVGENFIVLKAMEKDKSISFVLTGHSNKYGHIYTCVYSDLN